MAKILVVEDEETLCEALKFNLEISGYDVDTANSAEEALTLPLRSYDLILLDVMMGEINGFRFARMLRDNPDTASVPIIFCTAKDSEDEMVAGLGLADDYITKPYTLRNVLARIQSVLRRAARHGESNRQDTSDTISIPGITIDNASHRLFVDGTEVPLPRKELETLRLLLSSPGKIFSRKEILDHVWDNEAIVLERTVDVNINRLRRKLGPYASHIVTRSGYGYGFKP